MNSGDVREAAARIAGRVRRTPLATSRWLSAVAGREVLLKLETHQLTGSFKVRGAMNAMLSLPEAVRARGVVTASAGNHGLGVALAAADLGVPARIHLPANAPAVKRDRIAETGAEIVTVGGDYDDADAAARADSVESGATYVHAFGDPAVVAGQGTVGLEVVEDRPDVGCLLVPVGGGGLIGGIGVALREMGLRPSLVGVQSEHASAMAASLDAGQLRPGPRGPTLCDGLAGDTNAAALDLARQVVDDIVVVPEADVGRAIVELHRHEGVLAEGSAAVAVAALLGGAAERLGGEGPIAAVLTGANIDLDVVAALTSNGSS